MIVQYFTACDQNIAVTFGYQNITHMCLSEPEHPDVWLMPSGSYKRNKADNKIEITYS